MVRQFELKRAALLLYILSACIPYGATQSAPPAPAISRQHSFSASAPARLARAPEFNLESTTGESLSLSSFRGKVVLLNFWATWCGPCKIEMSWLVDLQEEYGPQGLQIIGISLDDDATKVEIGEFADTMRTNYPILIGNKKVAEAYGGVPAMPESFFIGQDGKIFDRIIGLKSKTEIKTSIRKAMNARSETGQAERVVAQAQN